MRFGGATAPVRSKFSLKEWSAGLKTRPKMTVAQKAAFTEELRTADIFVSGTGSELFVNFGKAIAGNVVMAAAMVALGFVIPKKAQKGLTYAFDALAVAELLAGNPAMALMTGGMELWKEFGVQAKRKKYNIESGVRAGRQELVPGVRGPAREVARWHRRARERPGPGVRARAHNENTTGRHDRAGHTVPSRQAPRVRF